MLTINQPVPAIQYPNPHATDLLKACQKFSEFIIAATKIESEITMMGLKLNGLKARTEVAPINPKYK